MEEAEIKKLTGNTSGSRKQKKLAGVS